MVHVRAELGVARARRRRVDARRAASTRRSRRRASRSSTARRSSCSRTRTSRTAPSRGSIPDVDDAAGHLDRVRDRRRTTATAGSSRTSATPRRSRGRGRFPERPGSSTGSAGSRRRTRPGNVSYDPENHDRMVRLRAAKVAGIAADIPELEVDDPDGADTLVLGWGSTYGAIGAAARRVRASGRKVATAHLHYLNPFPRNTGEVVRALRQGAHPGDEPRPAADAHPRRVPRRRGRATTRCAGARSGRPSSRTRSRRWWTR